MKTVWKLLPFTLRQLSAYAVPGVGVQAYPRLTNIATADNGKKNAGENFGWTSASSYFGTQGLESFIVSLVETCEQS